jgi:hypothetical protein
MSPSPFALDTAKCSLSQVRVDLRKAALPQGLRPYGAPRRSFPSRLFACQYALILFARHPLGGPYAALQTSCAVQHFRSPHGLLKCCTEKLLISRKDGML